VEGVGVMAGFPEAPDLEIGEILGSAIRHFANPCLKIETWGTRICGGVVAKIVEILVVWCGVWGLGWRHAPGYVV